jgi:peptidoglycan LD-endopeptidase CwlK
MTNDIEQLKPQVRKAAHAFLADLRAQKVPFVVTSTLRSDIEQVALYLQGRASLEIVNLVRKFAGMYLLGEKENTYTVTRCDGVNTKSNHQLGIALDVVPMGELGGPIWPAFSDPRWLVLGVTGEKYGFRWAGRWQQPDPPHHEYIA